jgi:hypothetical protein
VSERNNQPRQHVWSPLLPSYYRLTWPLPPRAFDCIEGPIFLISFFFRTPKEKTILGDAKQQTKKRRLPVWGQRWGKCKA